MKPRRFQRERTGAFPHQRLSIPCVPNQATDKSPTRKPVPTARRSHSHNFQRHHTI
jgi:hypothetical protein